jgi:hypothetical protein
MNPQPWLAASACHGVAALAVVWGLALIWRGLRGGREGGPALLRQGVDMLHRMEGFRLTVFGLALVGIAIAAILQAKWLLLLSLGIGFVEILESSTLIAIWKWDGTRR